MSAGTGGQIRVWATALGKVATLVGTVVRFGRERSLPTPLSFAIYAALRPTSTASRST